MKVWLNDKVKILSGKDSGKEGKVVAIYPKMGKIVVEGINIVKKHVKKGAVNKEGGIIAIEKPLDVSNVALMCPKCSKPVRIAYSLVGKKKYRICKKCGEVLDKAK